MATEYNDRFFNQWVNLADQRLGTKVSFATDDFFAEKENLIKPGRGIFIPDKYTDRGKWMDGWESRRKRTPGHDHAIVKLGAPGIIRGVDIDTNHFLGNHPPFASLEARPTHSSDKNQWIEILSRSPLQPGSQNLFEIHSEQSFDSVRLNIYPDGGVARLRVYGEVTPPVFQANQRVDFASVRNGGKVLACNDSFFSSKDNLIMPGRGVNMGDGWETRRRREPGNDWLILELGAPARLEEVTIDTAHFKGNYPDRFSLEGTQDYQGVEQTQWTSLLEPTPLGPDREEQFALTPPENLPFVSHVRLNIFPDGGVSRLRLWGKSHANG